MMTFCHDHNVLQSIAVGACRLLLIMFKSRSVLRVATYNIHKCRGMDRRVRPDRIVSVLREFDADIIALQEVVSLSGGSPEEDQARFVAEELGLHFSFGENRRHKGGRYGNVLLTRLPIESQWNYDISAGGREPRGCLRTDIRVDGKTVHVFNVHFGTRFFEQRRQVRKLIEDEIVTHSNLQGPRIVLGDFNEWLRGSVTSTMTAHLEKANVRRNLRRSRTFPGRFPIFRLDHIYIERSLRLRRLYRHKSRTALVASDHLPLVADLVLDA
jgi:endonuclease/exonuclease/phosphatase family metal-dependent hydrolase